MSSVGDSLFGSLRRARQAQRRRAAEPSQRSERIDL
jgi:hypothetical protein